MAGRNEFSAVAGALALAILLLASGGCADSAGPKDRPEGLPGPSGVTPSTKGGSSSTSGLDSVAKSTKKSAPIPALGLAAGKPTKPKQSSIERAPLLNLGDDDGTPSSGQGGTSGAAGPSGSKGSSGSNGANGPGGKGSAGNGASGSGGLGGSGAGVAGSGDPGNSGGEGRGTQSGPNSGPGAGSKGAGVGPGGDPLSRSRLPQLPITRAQPNKASSPADAVRRARIELKDAEENEQRGTMNVAASKAYRALLLVQQFPDDPECQALAKEIEPQVIKWSRQANAEFSKSGGDPGISRPLMQVNSP